MPAESNKHESPHAIALVLFREQWVSRGPFLTASKALNLNFAHDADSEVLKGASLGESGYSS